MPVWHLVWDLVVVGALALWLIATAAHSFGVSGRIEPKLGLFAQLLPGWNFFAPTPNMADYFLLYRDYYDTTDATPWRQVHALGPSRHSYAWLWNPAKLSSKALFDIIQALGLESRGTSARSRRLLQLSVPYLHLLSYIGSVARWPPPRATQFMIMRRESMHHESEVILVSAVHETDAGEPVAVHAGGL